MTNEILDNSCSTTNGMAIEGHADVVRHGGGSLLSVNSPDRAHVRESDTYLIDDAVAGFAIRGTWPIGDRPGRTVRSPGARCACRRWTTVRRDRVASQLSTQD